MQVPKRRTAHGASVVGLVATYFRGNNRIGSVSPTDAETCPVNKLIFKK